MGQWQAGAVLNEHSRKIGQGLGSRQIPEAELRKQCLEDGLEKQDGRCGEAFGHGLFGEGLAVKNTPQAGPPAQGDILLKGQQAGGL